LAIDEDKQGNLRYYTNICILSLSVKPIFWAGASLADLRDFPVEARVDASYARYLVQLGLEPPDWRPMPTVGAGASEIRVHADNEYRVIYIAKFPEGIYVLHAFAKYTRQTRQADIECAGTRLSEIVEWRRRRSAQHRKKGR
jgi:phage-related protein